MSRIARFLSALNPWAESRRLRQQVVKERKRYSAIVAANVGKARGSWSGVPSGEDALNKEYLEAFGEVVERSQDLDANNPDVRGFHRARVAQVVGRGVKFKHAPRAKELGLTPAQLLEISSRVDRARALHSKLGGFDSTGNNRSEGTQQVRAMLTTFVTGLCLVHRVWQPNPRTRLPFTVELIPGTRVSTPYDRLADPLISYGIQYEDEHRTRVTGFHVRRVSRTIGNSFIPEFVWDFVPVEDCAVLMLPELAGIDRTLPLGLANVRMLRNRGEFIEASVESARAQAGIFAAIQCASGQNPYVEAANAADEVDESGAVPMQFVDMGSGVKAMFLFNGEKIDWNSAKLPEPDFSGFMDVTDERLARGFSSSLARFTRKVNSSWAGGRLEDQQDDPIIDQYREAFISCWQRVNEWFLEALWLTGAAELPGFNDDTRAVWTEFRAEFPGKLHINPQDTMAAREKGYALRTLAPQQACEEDGKDLRDNLRLWAEALSMAREIEQDEGLPEGSLDFILSGSTVSTSAGEEIKQQDGQGEQSQTSAPKDDPGNRKAAIRMRDHLRAAGVRR